MKSTFRYDHYWKYEELSENLKALAEKYSVLCTLYSLAKTPEGRDIWCAEVTDPETGSCAEKPAYYVDGSTHAGEVTGSMSAVYFLDYLLTNSESSDEVKKLLKEYAFYFIPRISPDGGEYYLTTPNRVRSVNRSYPYEQELDGLHAADMDGDGCIRSVRVRSPYGLWKISPRDPRLMVHRRPDETEGEFYNVYTEGEISGFDGVHVSEAPSPYGNDFNRNYPIAWGPESTQKGAGLYPLSNIETKTVADFIIAHKNIGSVITFHTSGGMFLYPPGFIPSKKAFPEDMAQYHAMGKIATEETGYPVVNLFDEYTPEGEDISSGAMDDWCHFDRGIPAFTIECWDATVRAGIPHVWPMPSSVSEEEQEEQMEKLVNWSDRELDGEGFKPWTPGVHPQLGEVEYGGFDYKYVFQNCPPKFLLQEVEKHTRYMLRAVKLLPKLAIDRVSIKQLAEGLFRIEAVVGNRGYLSTFLTKEAVKLGVDVPVTVSINTPDIDGQTSRKIGHLDGRAAVDSWFSTYGMSQALSNQQKSVSFTVSAPAGTPVTITACCPSGGTVSVTKELL